MHACVVDGVCIGTLTLQFNLSLTRLSLNLSAYRADRQTIEQSSNQTALQISQTLQITILKTTPLSRTNTTTPTMADPFEVRMKFTSLLSHLNASTNSALKTAHYALRHSAFAEDLHSCILEQLERNNLNSRANIMYFLPALCDAAKAQNELTYVRMMERDILRIVDLVAPPQGGGAANVRVVRSVLKGLEGRGFLQQQTVGELEEFITGRDAAGAPESPPMAGGGGAEDGTPSMARNTPASVREPWAAPAVKLDKRQVEQRIEEDRERHKRAREGIWAIRQSSNDLGDDAEKDKLWAETSDMEDDDYEMVKEEADQRKECLSFEKA
jgi:CTD kinase subunit gamma